MPRTSPLSELQQPNTVFEPTIDVEDVKNQPNLLQQQQVNLVAKGTNVAVQTSNGQTLGYLTEYDALKFVEEIKAREASGIVTTSVAELRATQTRVFGEIALPDRLDSSSSVLANPTLAKPQRPADFDTTLALKRAENGFEDRKKSSTTMWILWFFLGGLGVHRFYLGDTAYAIGMIVLAVGTFLMSLMTFFLIPFYLAVTIWWLAEIYFCNKRLQDVNREIRKSVYEENGIPEYA